MAKYLVTVEKYNGDLDNNFYHVAQSRSDVYVVIKAWVDGCYIGDGEPVAYELGAKMTAEIKTTIELKGG